MLDRVLEPEVMDTAADAAAYDDMDHAEVNLRFVDDLLRRLRLSGKSRHELGAGPSLGAGLPTPPHVRPKVSDPPYRVLDLGAGTALIPITLCQQFPGCHVTAVEAAGSMIDLARVHLEQARLADRITLAHADAKHLPDALGQFDVVMSNSLVHHLADPTSMLAGVVAHTAPGGLLFVRDLLRPPDTTKLKQLVDTYAADARPEQRRLFADSLHAALTLDEIRNIVATLSFPRDTVAQTSDRHWTWSAMRGVSG